MNLGNQDMQITMYENQFLNAMNKAKLNQDPYTDD